MVVDDPRRRCSCFGIKLVEGAREVKTLKPEMSVELLGIIGIEVIANGKSCSCSGWELEWDRGLRQGAGRILEGAVSFAQYAWVEKVAVTAHQLVLQWDQIQQALVPTVVVHERYVLRFLAPAA